jgi:hypothetical protein
MVVPLLSGDAPGRLSPATLLAAVVSIGMLSEDGKQSVIPI